MKCIQTLAVLLLGGLISVAEIGAAETPPARLDEKQREFFKSYCVECHNAEKQEGKLRLDDIAFEIGSIELADRWQKILNQLNAGEMPPEDAKQPERGAKTEFLDALSHTLVTARQSLGDVRGKITMRRLNRREYKNTIRDLLGVDLRVNELPADGGAGTFDTVGSSLFMSSDQFEQYLALGRQAIDESFARFAPSQPARRMHVEAEERNARIAKALEQRVADRDRYVKWTTAVDEAAKKPENVELTALIRDEKKGNATHLYFQWQRLKGAPSPKDFGFVDAVNADEMGRRDWVHYVPHHKAYLAQPGAKTGSYLTFDDVFVNPYQPFRVPGDWPPGDYIVRVRIAATENAPPARRFVEFGSQHDSGVRAVISSHQITGTMAQPQVLEIPLKFSPQKGHGFFFQEKGSFGTDVAANRLFAEAKQLNGIGPEFALWLDWIEVESAAAAKLPVASATPPQRMRLEGEEASARIARTMADRAKIYERYLTWTAAVDAVAQRPENAALAAKLRSEKPANPADFYLAWQKLPGAPSPVDYGFQDAAQADVQGRYVWTNNGPYFRYYLEQPGAKSGAYLTIGDTAFNPSHSFQLPGDWLAGDYVVRVRMAATENTPATRHFVEFGSLHDPLARGVASKILSTHQITGTPDKPQLLEIPLKFFPAEGRGFFLREKGTQDSEEVGQRLVAEAKKRNGIGPEVALWIDWIEVANASAVDAIPTTIKQRREVELHANAMVGGTYNGYFKGGYEAAKEFLATGQPQKGIPDEQEAKFRVKVFQEHGPTFTRYLDDPLTKTGAYLTIFNVHPEEVITLPPDQPSGWLKTKHEIEKAPSGDYVLRFRIGTVKGTPKERHFVTLGSRMKPEEKEDFTLMQTFQISGTTDEPQVIEVPVSIIADGPRTFVLREKRDVKLDHEIYTAARKETGVGPVSALWIDWVEWEGPLSSNSPRGIEPVLFANTTGLSERDHARAILERFAVRAFRDQTPKPEYVDKLVKLFETRQQAGDKFDIAIREPLSVVLASPRFLYLQETGGLADAKKAATNVSPSPAPPVSPSANVSLSSTELATRLSYFLWSAPPDETLLALARSGDLQRPDMLAAQVDRMLSHEKSREFVQGFVPQWLSMERLDFFQFNTQLFRDFDESMKAAARREVYETVAFLLRENGSARDLLKSDYVVVNGLLANFYGLDGVSGDEFRKVPLPADSPRGGLLGMSAIMAMGSNGEVSSPVERGAWVLRKLLHDPPPPAPPNVPQLTRLEGKLLTTRERIMAHQEQPQCASCHRKIDPIGFGLENFNAVGKWRTEDRYEKKGVGKKEWPIDPSGSLHKGPSFKTYFELRDIIALKPDQFSRGLTEALIEYAFGRPYGFADEALATTVVQRASQKDFALREFIHAIVQSQAFQTK